MYEVKTYSYLEKKEKLFGLEVVDFLCLAVVYAVIFLLSSNLITNVVILLLVYLGIRFYKKGKPPGYTLQLLRFIGTPKMYVLPGKETF